VGGSPAPDAALAPFARAALPVDVQHPTFVDFGGKVQLVGYDVSPEGMARPGETVKLRMYWKRTGTLQPGFRLFTHLDDELGAQIRNFDQVGDFRGALAGGKSGLSALELGKVYVDEQTVEVPKGAEVTPRVTLVVGVWKDDVRLPVVSGSTNGHHAAVVSSFSTGVVRRRTVPAAPPRP